ncbi:hypothetical protein KKA00_01520, partial [bacterium]|nr:hypothetical protein [bacterium]
EIGLLNVAQKAYGMQIGLFNYAESLEGLPIGLISFVRDYPLRLDFWWSETAALSVALRSGNGRYYNLLAISANPYQENFHWTVGWGLGRAEGLSRNSYLDTDFMIHQVYSDGGGLDDHNLLLKLRALYGRNLYERLDIYAGPTLNLLFSESESADNVALWGPENPTWERGDTGIYFWPGIVLGVRY